MKSLSKQFSSSEETRKRLIDAGVKLFGLMGKDTVSTRDLAKVAATNLNAIQYHFGGKDELYLAVARHLAQQINSEARPMIANIQSKVDQMNPSEAAQSAADLIALAAKTFLNMPDLALRGGFMLREQLQPGDAFDKVIYPEFIEPMHKLLTALVARATGDRTNSAKVITRTHALYGQALGFGAAGETWRRRLGTKAKNSEQSSKLALEAIRQTTLATLAFYASDEGKRI